MKYVCSKSMLLSSEWLLDLLFTLALQLSLFLSFSITGLFNLQKLFNFIHRHVQYISFKFESFLHVFEIAYPPFLRIGLNSLRWVHLIILLPLSILRACEFSPYRIKLIDPHLFSSSIPLNRISPIFSWSKHSILLGLINDTAAGHQTALNADESCLSYIGPESWLHAILTESRLTNSILVLHFFYHVLWGNVPVTQRILRLVRRIS